MADTWSVPTQTVAHKRVMQLRQLASIIRRRAMSCNKLPQEKPAGSKPNNNFYDEDIRPRTLSSTAAENSNKLRRRSMRKQRYYGSTDLAGNTNANGEIKTIGRFRVEPADSVEGEIYSGENELPTNPVMVEDPEVETRWYIRHFLGREHQNFAGVDNHKSPYFLSVQIDEEVEANRCRAILWQSTVGGRRREVICGYVPLISRVQGPKKLVFPYHQATQKPLTAKSVMHKFPGMNELNHSLKEITDPKLQKDLLLLEEQEGAVNFKFGIIYSLQDQKSDDDMLSNENGSEHFQKFVELLGEKVQLQNWSKFKGGLDTKTGSTGQCSYYTLYEGHEIMFHVSTLLPFSKENKQQLERKRHIGNDIVNIIYQEGGDPLKPTFNPSAMKSQFTHIFAVVTYEAKTDVYRLWVFSEETVPAYGPALPNPAEFYNSSHFKQFLLTKIINGEKAAFRSQVFAEKRRRTTDTLIKDMYMEYLKKEIHRGHHLPKMTEALVRPLKSPRNKELDHHLVEFLQLGEHLKLSKSLNGEAPNLLTVNHLYRKQPWEPQFLSAELPQHSYISSDSWGNRTLLLATEDAGTLSVNEAVCTVIFDPACQVQQVTVLENFGITLIQCEHGKENYLCVFSLVHLRSCIRSAVKLQKSDCQANKIADTKGCQYFAVSGNQSFRLSLAFNVGRKINLFKWNLSQVTQLTNTSDIASNFEFAKEIHVTDDPLSICLFESGVQALVKAAVVNKSGVDILDFNNATVTTLHKCPLSKKSFTSLIASSDLNSEDILLTFHNTTLVFDLCEEECRPLSICWTTDPQSIAYCFPFVLAFGSDTIEIRLAVNGNLFASLYMPSVSLLASKEDIFFSTKEQPWSLNCSTNGRTIVKQNDPTFLCLYKIPVKNLLKGDTCTSPSKPGSRSPIGGVSPQMNRSTVVPKPGNVYSKIVSPVLSRKDSKLVSPVLPRKEYFVQKQTFDMKSSSGCSSDSGCSQGRNSAQGSPDEKSTLTSFNGDVSDVLL